MMRDPLRGENVERTYEPASDRDTLLTITVRKDATARVEGQGRTWETSGHLIVLRTPQGGELQVTWPEDFQPQPEEG